MRAATVWTSSTVMYMMRTGVGEDLRHRHVSQRDIDLTTLYLGGAERTEKHFRIWQINGAAWAASFVWLLFIKRPSPRLHRFEMGASITFVTLSTLFVFQQCGILLHIRDRHVVAAVLRERLPGVLEDEVWKPEPNEE
ncbi:uncharacterized protein C8Q71DRAFT_112216 [Rhodofomes roseus]|uniref:Transmembrane protein n=1 Tax=Rhodofomes roseus TaxID=34475 RepID=A0ABQ8KDE6_9APHY|nr:uncharacterized protein C8Q71DRAFT_112216 [Rhodofomes roseus]KAH9835292.1 hypothetical protein C8Q71DRAFT_112216 [Rhodofomes roseus]